MAIQEIGTGVFIGQRSFFAAHHQHAGAVAGVAHGPCAGLSLWVGQGIVQHGRSDEMVGAAHHHAFHEGAHYCASRTATTGARARSPAFPRRHLHHGLGCIAHGRRCEPAVGIVGQHHIGRCFHYLHIGHHVRTAHLAIADIADAYLGHVVLLAVALPPLQTLILHAVVAQIGHGRLRFATFVAGEVRAHYGHGHGLVGHAEEHHLLHLLAHALQHPVAHVEHGVGHGFFRDPEVAEEAFARGVERAVAAQHIAPMRGGRQGHVQATAEFLQAYFFQGGDVKFRDHVPAHFVVRGHHHIGVEVHRIEEVAFIIGVVHDQHRAAGIGPVAVLRQAVGGVATGLLVGQAEDHGGRFRREGSYELVVRDVALYRFRGVRGGQCIRL